MARERVFDHVVIIMFENEYRNAVRQNPYMRELASKGIDMATYFGVMHPSNTNYVASIAGETCNITSDPQFNTLIPGAPPATPPTPFDMPTLVDNIRKSGLDWRAYMQLLNPVHFPPQFTYVYEQGSTTAIDYTATVRHTVLDYPPFVNMHNAFVRFQSIVGDPEQWKCITTLDQFLTDCANGTLPAYSWITPDAWSDGHWLWGSYQDPPNRAPVLVDQLAQWLQGFFAMLDFPGPNSRIPPRTMVVVTFDESEYNKDYQAANNLGADYDGPNQVYTVLLGDMCRPGVMQDEGFNHYSLMRTVEENFGIPDLGKNDREANYFRFLWGGEHFRWHGVGNQTSIFNPTYLAAAGWNDTCWIVYGTAEDGANCWKFDKDMQWSDGGAVGVPSGVTAAAMAACGDAMLLIVQTSAGLWMIQCEENGKWSQAQQIVTGTIGSFAATTFVDYGDNMTEKVMLVYASGGVLQSQVYANGAWAAAVSVNQQTDGAITVSRLGPSVYLIFKITGTNGMNVTSYNTAPFNVVTSGTYSNTTQYAWSAAAFPVAHFSYAPDRADEDVAEPVTKAYEGVAPFVSAYHEGVLHLATVSTEGPNVLTETFSLNGLFTPLYPVDNTKGAQSSSDGWGTLAEAGWTIQQQLGSAMNAPNGVMAMASFGKWVMLLFQPEAGDSVRMNLGWYDCH